MGKRRANLAGRAPGGALLALLVCLAGCPPRPTSTRLTAGDLDQTVVEVARQLAASDFLRDRGPDSPRIVITTNKVVNLTSDLIPEAEQWMMVNRVQASLPLRALANQKNIRFQVPPERAALLREHGFPDEGSGYIEPTHVMAAEFRSATRAGSGPGESLTDLRSDYYWLEYRVFEVRSRKLEWSGAFELKRQARGLTID